MEAEATGPIATNSTAPTSRPAQQSPWGPATHRDQHSLTGIMPFMCKRRMPGNWSASSSYGISVDTAAPTGSIQITPASGMTGATVTNNPLVTLNLTCGDGTGSGCFWMQFSNDGTNWSALEQYATTRAAYALSTGDGAKLVYAKYQDSAAICPAPKPQPYFSTPPHRSQQQCRPAAPIAPSRS